MPYIELSLLVTCHDNFWILSLSLFLLLSVFLYPLTNSQHSKEKNCNYFAQISKNVKNRKFFVKAHRCEFLSISSTTYNCDYVSLLHNYIFLVKAVINDNTLFLLSSTLDTIYRYTVIIILIPEAKWLEN